MNDLLGELRSACTTVASRAEHVRINGPVIEPYAAGLELVPSEAVAPASADREQTAAFWLTLDAINFGSGWFPTLRKPPGKSGYLTIATGIRDRFDHHGPWSAAELEQITAGELASVTGQDPTHELIGLFATSLRDLGARIGGPEFGGRFAAVVDAAGGSAAALVQRLASWDSFEDTSSYDELAVPFLKRAQIAAADLTEAGVADFHDLERLTMFADNLVPHVLRLDRVLSFEPELVNQIERGELIEHGSAAEVEIRACALHAVELIVAARPDSRASQIDNLLWHRGQGAAYKARPRHRSRCTAY